MSREALAVVLVALGTAGAGANPKVHVTYHWHQHQPIYCTDVEAAAEDHRSGDARSPVAFSTCQGR